MSFQAVILAAGKGTRMKSELPKVLHKLAGRPMIEYVLDASVAAGISDISVVVGFGAQQVIDTVTAWNKQNAAVQVTFCTQAQQHGTGHALACAKPAAANNHPYLIVLLGDVPLIESATISEACAQIEQEEASAIVISATLQNPHGYGRIIKNAEGQIEGIVEEKDATPEQREICEINTGIFLFNNRDVWDYLAKLKPENSQNEYYLTDVVRLINEDGKSVNIFHSPNPDQFLGINSVENLQNLEKEMQVQT